MKQIRQLVKEIIPVILGILIALIINNWNENRKEKKYLDQIFTSIESELEESIIDLNENNTKNVVCCHKVPRGACRAVFFSKIFSEQANRFH